MIQATSCHDIRKVLVEYQKIMTLVTVVLTQLILAWLLVLTQLYVYLIF